MSFVNVNFSGVQRPFRLHGLSIQHLSPPLKSQLKKRGITKTNTELTLASDGCRLLCRRWPSPAGSSGGILPRAYGFPLSACKSRTSGATSSPTFFTGDHLSQRAGGEGGAGVRLEEDKCPGHSTQSWVLTCVLPEGREWGEKDPN